MEALRGKTEKSEFWGNSPLKLCYTTDKHNSVVVCTQEIADHFYHNLNADDIEWNAAKEIDT